MNNNKIIFEIDIVYLNQYIYISFVPKNLYMSFCTHQQDQYFVCLLIYASSIAVMLGEQENRQKGLFPFFRLPKI